jgi:parallel beta-helix repeat protein
MENFAILWLAKYVSLAVRRAGSSQMASRSIFITAVVVSCLPLNAGAFTWHVPSGAPTIQAGIDSAAAGDTVLVACGTYYEHDIVMKSGVVFAGENGSPDSVTINASGLGRVLFFDHADGSTRIEGLTLTGGYASGAGPELCGGGIYCADSSPTIARCTVTGNSADYYGGGIYLDDSSPNLVECTVSGNSSPYSGGIHAGNSSPNLCACIVSDNASDLYGGGMWCRDSSSPVLTHCTFFGNLSGAGGGLYISGCSCPSLVGCTLSGNSTFGGHGGGIYIYCATVTVENTIVAFSAQGEGVYCYPGAGATLACCDVYGNTDGNWVGCIAEQCGVDGNFRADPLFCDPEAGDFRLGAQSPCAPAHSPAGCGLIGANGLECGDTTAGVDVENRVPVQFHVEPAAPNPFSAWTEIAYCIPPDAGLSPVRVSLYDSLGREVTRRVDTDVNPGEHRVIWDGRDRKGHPVASGVYFYRISWNGTSETRRLVLVR